MPGAPLGPTSASAIPPPAAPNQTQGADPEQQQAPWFRNNGGERRSEARIEIAVALADDSALREQVHAPRVRVSRTIEDAPRLRQDCERLRAEREFQVVESVDAAANVGAGAEAPLATIADLSFRRLEPVDVEHGRGYSERATQ